MRGIKGRGCCAAMILRTLETESVEAIAAPARWQSMPSNPASHKQTPVSVKQRPLVVPPQLRRHLNGMRRLQRDPIHGGKHAHLHEAPLSSSAHGSTVCVYGRRGNLFGVQTPLPLQRMKEQDVLMGLLRWLSFAQCVRIALSINAERITAEEASTPLRQSQEKNFGATEMSKAVGACLYNKQAEGRDDVEQFAPVNECEHTGAICRVAGGSTS